VSLRVAEQEYWRDRLARLYEERKAQIRAEHPGVEGECLEKANEVIKGELGIENDLRAIEQMDEDLAALKKARDTAQKELYERVTGEDVPTSTWQIEKKLKDHIDGLVKAKARTLMREHPIGQELAHLSDEANSAMDAVMLASSAEPIQKLLANISQQVGVTLSDGERLAIGQGSTDG